MNFLGYKRPDGRVGVRNYVLVLPASVCATDTAVLFLSRFRAQSLSIIKMAVLKFRLTNSLQWI